jgi:hypothetical protein
LPEAGLASRVAIGHAEGMPLAFANIYADLAKAIAAQKQGLAMDPTAAPYPTAVDGLHSMSAIVAAVVSAKGPLRPGGRSPAQPALIALG